MKVLILAGGEGKRLGQLTKNCPKPMLDFDGKPWLVRIINQLNKQGLCEFIVSVGFQSSKIIDCLPTLVPEKVSIKFDIDEPLSGTGGAIYKVATKISEKFLVLNGDSYIADFDVKRFCNDYFKQRSRIHLAAVKVDNVSRFGSLSIGDDRITAFREKGKAGSGYINAGIYLFDSNDLCPMKLTKFSFESDIRSK